jgi:predicted ATPase/class 3 adenylate cyclase
VSDIAEWLEGLGLGEYAEAFAENRIDLGVLPRLTGNDLKEIGVIAAGDRRRLLDAIAPLTEQDPQSGDEDTPAAGTPGDQRTEAERRQLTVMFCDLVGSTALSQRLDPEDLRDLMRRYQDAVAGAVTRYGGHVAKYLGDGVLAYFGWPQAYEDQAERAVRAGLDAVVAVSAVKMADDDALAARVGIATGHVVVGDLVGESGRDAEAVSGEAPNLAARLQGVAEPGQVVIGEATHRLVGQTFAVDDIGGHDLKGFDNAVQAWRIAGEVVAESRFEAAHGASLTRFVGRETELQLLFDRWQLAEGGEGQAVLISGEAGIGKSRLMQGLRDQVAERDHIRIRYQCSPFHINSALYPVIRQLVFAAGFAPEDTAERKLDKLEALLVRSTRPVADVISLFAALLSIPMGDRLPALSMTPERQRKKTLEALVEQLIGLAARQPVLFVLEDAHWIDPTTLELMDLLIAKVEDVPVLVVITFRPEFSPPWQTHGHVTTLMLNRLTRRQSATIITAVAEGTKVPEGLANRIANKSDGVPLFIEELTRAVLEAGVTGTSGGAEPQSWFAVPTTLQDALAARLDRLAEAKEVAQIGAVIGREFSHELLGAISFLSGSALDEALDRLVRSGLVFRRGSGSGAAYIFKHALVQDTAYQSLLKSRRREIHERTAMALRERGGDQHEPELLAHHLTEAGATEDAVTYWHLAGQKDAEHGACAEAVAHLTKGLSQLGTLPESPGRDKTEAEMRLALGLAYRAVKGSTAPEVGRAYARARDLANKTGQGELLVHALYGQFVHALQQPDVPTARHVAAEFLRLARHEGGVVSALARDVAGIVSFHFGRFPIARRHFEKAVQYEGKEQAHRQLLEQTHFPANCLIYLAWTLFALGYLDQARQRREEAMVAAQHMSPFAQAMVLANVCHTAFCEGDMNGLLEAAERKITLHTEQSMPEGIPWGEMYKGAALAGLGRPEEGIDLMQRGTQTFRSRGHTLEISYLDAILAQAYAAVGRVKEGMKLIDDALVELDQTGERWQLAEVHRMRGEVLMIAENPSEAEASFKRALEVARGQHARLWELQAARSLARLWRDQGRRAEARNLLAPVYDWFTEGFDTPDFKNTRALLDQLQ